jgi:putative phage-type endonuclease
MPPFEITPVDAPQGSQDWLQARVGRLTASRYTDVLAKPETAAYRGYLLQIVTERLTQQSQESGFVNEAMQWGTDTEPLARAAYEVDTGDVVTECGLILRDDWIAGSPDGLIGDEGLIEIKCPRSTTHIDWIDAGGLPAKHKPQVQGLLLVTGRKWAHFCSYDPRMPPHLRLWWILVKADEKYQSMLLERLLAFRAEAEKMIARLTGDDGQLVRDLTLSLAMRHKETANG